jgi:SAM-dependent methyltransferase
MSDFTELIIGCGAQKNKKMMGSDDKKTFVNPTTLDINPDHKPDIVHDLEVLPLPFDDDSFNEIHAYEVLEHTGAQGDYIFFFAQFSEFWRILKPNGHLCATVPAWNSLWAWGDPSHKRIINQGTLVFLSQQEYEKQIGKTAMSDFRYLYKADFKTVFVKPMTENLYFMLKAIKL